MVVNDKWREFQDECPDCGANPVMAQVGPYGYHYVGSQAMCPDCGLLGEVDADGDDDDTAWVEWVSDDAIKNNG